MVSVVKKNKRIGSMRDASLRGSRRQAPSLYPTEEQEQMALAKYLEYRFDGYWFHVPNENMAKAQFRHKLKLMGQKNGVPDILIIVANKVYSGIAIELKRQKGGRLEASQKLWLDRFDAEGWLAFVARGAQDAIDKIEKYYGGKQ